MPADRTFDSLDARSPTQSAVDSTRVGNPYAAAAPFSPTEGVDLDGDDRSQTLSDVEDGAARSSGKPNSDGTLSREQGGTRSWGEVLYTRNPVPALLGAALLGFVLAKAFAARD